MPRQQSKSCEVVLSSHCVYCRSQNISHGLNVLNIHSVAQIQKNSPVSSTYSMTLELAQRYWYAYFTYSALFFRRIINEVSWCGNPFNILGQCFKVFWKTMAHRALRSKLFSHTHPHKNARALKLGQIRVLAGKLKADPVGQAVTRLTEDTNSRRRRIGSQGCGWPWVFASRIISVRMQYLFSEAPI